MEFVVGIFNACKSIDLGSPLGNLIKNIILLIIGIIVVVGFLVWKNIKLKFGQEKSTKGSDEDKHIMGTRLVDTLDKTQREEQTHTKDSCIDMTTSFSTLERSFCLELYKHHIDTNDADINQFIGIAKESALSKMKSFIDSFSSTPDEDYIGRENTISRASNNVIMDIKQKAVSFRCEDKVIDLMFNGLEPIVQKVITNYITEIYNYSKELNLKSKKVRKEGKEAIEKIIGVKVSQDTTLKDGN